MTNDPFYKRAYIIGGVAIAIVAIFLLRLFYMQVIDRSTRERADNNALLKQTIYPSRGLIYDRNGELLVFNQPVYDVMLITCEMKNGFDTLGFCQALQISTQEFEERMTALKDRKKNYGYSPYTPQVFMTQLSKEDISLLGETLYRFHGVNIRNRTLRDYTYNSATHILGNVGEVNQRDIDNDSYYQSGDYSGRDGLEKQYETILRGEKGVEIIMRDSRGQLQGSYHNGEDDLSPQSGTDMEISIDIHLQMLAEEMLAGKIGSAVAIEPKTGEILAMVSSPAWNPQELVGRQRGKNYNRLLHDPHKPLMNRAVQAQYSPGSTFKTLQALVALQEKSITPNTLYPCSGPGSTPIKCTHHHGSPVSLLEAIEQSCNPYFWCVFRDLLQKNGYGKDNKDFRAMFTRWREDVMSFGMGSTFEESDIPGQKGGSIPSTKLYDKFYGKTGWKAITIRSLSIGQGEVLVTPLQLANQVACIANEGYYITPHFLRHTLDSAHMEFTSTRHYTNVDSSYFPIVKEGMHRVMTNGTGRWYNIPELAMCGKTGTVQNSHGRDHAIFIGFAPKDDPKIAVAVAVENAGFGATWACPVAAIMMEKYLTDTITLTQHYNRMCQTHFYE